MHYCILVITKEFPTDEVIWKVMEPYSEEDFYDEDGDAKSEVYPQFLWDFYRLGGRYCGKIKLRINKEDETYNWGFYAKDNRSSCLFRSMLLENCVSKKIICFEEDYYPYIGYEDGYIRVDGAKIKDIIDFEDLALNHNWGFIGKDGEAYSRSYWNGNDFVDDEHYEDHVKSAIQDVDDCYACIIDIHD